MNESARGVTMNGLISMSGGSHLFFLLFIASTKT